MKKLFLILLLLVATIGYTQSNDFDLDKKYYDGGVSYFGYWSDVDSLSTLTYTTKYFDITGIDNQTIYLTYDYITVGNTDDSLRLILQGKTGNGSVSMTVNLDTLFLVGSTATSSKQITMSLTGFLGMTRFYITPFYASDVAAQNRINGSLKISIYAKLTDPIYKFNKSWY